jgi:hypothetical protein
MLQDLGDFADLQMTKPVKARRCGRHFCRGCARRCNVFSVRAVEKHGVKMWIQLQVRRGPLHNLHRLHNAHRTNRSFITPIVDANTQVNLDDRAALAFGFRASALPLS